MTDLSDIFNGEYQKSIDDVIYSKTKPFVAGMTDVGKLLAKTREDGRYTPAMYDCEMAIMKLIDVELLKREQVGYLRGGIAEVSKLLKEDKIVLATEGRKLTRGQSKFRTRLKERKLWLEAKLKGARQ